MFLVTKKTEEKMSKSQNKYRHELGKTCNTGAMTTLIAMLVTPRVTGQSLATFDYVVLIIVAFSFGLVGFLLLSEK